MKTYEDFLDEVMPHVPGCTNEIATQAIKNAVIEFCEKSLILQTDHDPMSVIAGEVDYDLEPPAGYLVSKILKAWFKNTELVPTSPDDIAKPALYNRDFTDVDAGRADPTLIIQKDERTFSLFPIPLNSEANVVTMRIALKPSRSSTKVDDLIYEDYAEVIAHGALTRLMLSPGKPYSQPQIGVARNNLFSSGINLARQRASSGHVRSTRQVQFRRI